MLLFPIAAITGLADVTVVALVSRVFNILVGQPNSPQLPFSEFFNQEPNTKIFILIAIYLGMNWIASFLRLYLKSSQEKLRINIWEDLILIAQKKIYKQEYEYFLQANTIDILNKVVINISRVSENFILPILHLISGVFVVSFICLAILSIAQISAIYLVSCLIVFYTLIAAVVTPIAKRAAKKRILLEKKISNTLSESLKTIIDLKLTKSDDFYINKFITTGQKYFPDIWKVDVLPEIPRALIEPLGISLIFGIGLIKVLSADGEQNIAAVIPFVATIAVACLKLTPPLQDIFRAITKIRSSIPDLEESLRVIELKTVNLIDHSYMSVSPEGIKPKNFIRLNNIKYQYPNTSKLVLNGISITIPVGSRVAFVGKTGSGKTTAANQLLCLLRPTSGSLELDGIEINENEISAWQRCCSYVPQSFTLLNTSIIENIAYGIESNKISIDRIWESLKAAKLDDIVSELPMGLYSKVGEGGIKFSGGQRQRLALARAFYRRSQVLILDEGTSALDNTTEGKIMNSIKAIGRSCTIIIIAHRLSTIKGSDKIYEFEEGAIKESGSFKELLIKSESFKEMVLGGNEILADIAIESND